MLSWLNLDWLSWEFRDPWFLLMGLLAPVVYFLAARRRSALRYSSLQIANQGPKSLRSRLAKLPAILSAVSMLCLAVALAGPRTPDAETRINREGIAVMMVIDRSGSMNARDLVKDDYGVDRLTVVKDVFKSFVLGDGNQPQRPDDMIGLVAFAGYADSLCPLTLDHGNLGLIVEDLNIVQYQNEDGTAIGDALGLAVERLRRNKAKSKVAILLTDGMNTAGVIAPKKAAELAAEQNIKVYTIGAGTDGLAPIPSVNPFTGRRELRRAYVEIDEETLKLIAEKTGGAYFRATDQDALADIYSQIDKLERTEVTETRYLQYTEHYASFVLTALGMMGVAAVTSRSIFRTLP